MSDFDNRKKQLLTFLTHDVATTPVLQQTATNERNGVYLTLAALEMERLGQTDVPWDAAPIDRALALLKARLDCCDFAQAALLRLLYRYPDSQLLTPDWRQRISQGSIKHIYWVNEPGEEHMCFCTENHQIIHHSNELLAGQRWPQETFDDGNPGEWHRQHAEKLIALWLDWRLRFGFSEWNSNCYYDEDLIALLNLADYAENPEIKHRSTAVIDLLLLHLAVNSYQGVFGSTHGRTYTRMTVNPLKENTRPVAWLCFGLGGYDSVLSMGTTMMAASDYAPPEILAHLAADSSTMENRERHSLDVTEAPEHGVDPHDTDNIGFFWGAQVFHHREVIEASRWLCTEKHYKWNLICQAYNYYQEQDHLGLPYEPDPDYQAMTQVNIYTYRTADYLLSCAQDYRKGRPGFQQHIWQATLPGNAVVYTTHPGAENLGKSRPDYWHGNGLMPRAVAHKNVLIGLYKLNEQAKPRFTDNEISGAHEMLYYTHAFFPQYLMDEITEANGWVMGRVGSSYVALRALGKMHWQAPQTEMLELLPGTPSTLAPYELISEGAETGWVLELGSERENGSYEQFCAGFANADLEGDIETVTYTSPSLGQLRFGWEGPALLNGEALYLGPYPRMNNKYCACPFDAPYERDYTIRFNGEQYIIRYR